MLKSTGRETLDAVADAALRLGRTAAGAADPHRPRARDRRAHLDHRPHHRTPSCAATPPPSRSPTDSSTGSCSRAVRRVRLLPEGGDPDPLKGTGLRPLPRHACSSTPAPPGSSRSTPTRASCGGTPTRSSPSPPTASPAQLTARAEAHTIRLALIYALLDGQRHIQTRAPPRRARALGLRRPLRRLGARPSDRRPARRTDPRRARPLPRRAHPHPDPRPLRSATSPPTASTKRSHALAAAGRAQPSKILTAGRPAELWTATTA